MSPAVVTAEAPADLEVVHEPTRDLFTAAGWTLSVWNDLTDGEPRVRDLDAAERLGFARPRDVRKLIERIWHENQRPNCRATVARQSTGNGGRREFSTQEYWLTEAELLKVIARCSTPIADAILDDMIRVYMAVRRQLATPTRAIKPRRSPVRVLPAEGGTLSLALSVAVAQDLRDLALTAGMSVEEVLCRIVATSAGAARSVSRPVGPGCRPTFVVLSPRVYEALSTLARRRYGDDSPGCVSAAAQSALVAHTMLLDAAGLLP